MLKRHCWSSSMHEVVRISCNEVLAVQSFLTAFPLKDRDPISAKQATTARICTPSPRVGRES